MRLFCLLPYFVFPFTMKPVSTVTLLFAALVLLGCNKRDDQTTQPSYPATNGVASFRIDNLVWAASATVSGSGGMLMAIRGTERLEIQFSQFNPGTYQLTTSGQPSIVLNDYGNPARDYVSFTCNPTGGNIQITNYTGTHITGTFNARVCNGSDQLELVQGVFTNIPIQ